MNKKGHWNVIKSTLKSPQDLAEHIEVPIGTLFFLAGSNYSFYRRDEKPKPDGRVRVFFKPQRKLPRQGDSSKVENLAFWLLHSAGVRPPRAS